jgi:hypothetical protein
MQKDCRKLEVEIEAYCNEDDIDVVIDSAAKNCL